MKFKLLTLVSAFLISGCASTSPALMAALAPAADIGDSVGCSKDDCKEYWERAQLWVVKHSKWKIQSATDVMIQTFNQSEYHPSYAFSVIKEPAGNGEYRISMTLGCGNPLGCSPKPLDVRNAFYYYVKTGNDLLSGAGYMEAIR